MKRTIILILILLILSSSAEAGEPIRRVLDNGLVAIVKENHNAPVVSIRAFIRTGSIFEGEYMGAGLSHYLEHLLFEGTETMTGEEIDTRSAELGGISNAYTWTEHTCYYRQGRAEYADEMLELICDNLYKSTLPPESLENQREVIHSEFRMGYDEPVRVMYKMMYKTVFNQHPVRHPVIGYEELFDRVTREDLLEYYHRMYIPENTVLVVVGDVDAEATFDKIEETFGAIPRGTPTLPTFPDEPLQVGIRYANEEMDVDAAYLMMAFRTARVCTPDSYPLDVLGIALGSGLNARLRKTIMYEKQLVTEIAAYSSTPKHYDGYFVVYAECSADKLDAARDAIYEEMMKLKEDKISEDELERAKKLLVANEELGRQTVEDQSEYLGIYEMDTGNMNFGEDYLEYIEEVTRDDIRDVAREYFFEDNMSVCTITPKGTEEDWEKVPLPDIKPEITKTVLGNGLTVLTRPNPEAPAVTILAAVDGGSRVAPTGKEGVADLTATMLLRGTKKRDREEIAAEIEERGGSIGSGAARDSISLSCELLPEDAATGVEIVADCLLNSKFDRDIFEEERTRLYQQVQSEDDDWETEAYKVMRREMYGEHPYATFVTGTEESINRLKTEDALSYYQANFAPERTFVAVFGDIDEREAADLVEKYFGKWEATPRPEPALPPIPTNYDERVVTKENDKAQAVTYYGFAGITVDDEDRYALDLIDSVLSGIYWPGGRLHNRLRGGNLVYVTHAYNATGREPGFFAIYAASAPADQAEVRRIIDEEIERIKTEPVPAEELERAKEVCATTNAVYRRQTDGDMAGLATGGELAGLGYDYLDDYVERIDALTADDVMETANKYLVSPVIVIASPPTPEEYVTPEETE
ncbi:MAG: insulinase family protein [bacterium]|nr:insulinase family protein [bacterium]